MHVLISRQVMSPGRTSCLVCSSHGGMKELIDRRTTRSRKRPDDSVESRPGGGVCDVPEEPRGQQDRQDLSTARATIAGLITAELVKLLRPGCTRTDLRNWKLAGDCQGESHRIEKGDGEVAIGALLGETPPHRINPPHETLGLGRNGAAGCVRVGKIPDPPRVNYSTAFDPFYGDRVRAVPEGFTEWGVEEIRPAKDFPTTTTSNSSGIRFHRATPAGSNNAAAVDPFSLRYLAQIVFARFGVDIKSVAAAAPGSECRAGGRERGGWTAAASGGAKLLWAEWEKVEGGDDEQTRGIRGRVTIPKVGSIELVVVVGTTLCDDISCCRGKIKHVKVLHIMYDTGYEFGAMPR